MLKKMIATGLLFAVGVSFGAVFTPVGMDITEIDLEAPAEQRKHSLSSDRDFLA